MSGLDEKGLKAAIFPNGENPLWTDMQLGTVDETISRVVRYLASATPADVGEEPVARYRKLERELSSTKNTDLRADIKDDIIGMAAELATALERVVRERDEARAAVAYEAGDPDAFKYHKALFDKLHSAEAKLAEARKVIEPFAEQSKRFDDAADQMGFARSFDEYKPATEFTHGHLRAARRFLEETK